MIVMSQIRKRLLYGIAIGLGVGILGVIASIVISNSIIKSYEQGTNKDFIKNYMVDVVVPLTEITQGEKISSDMMTQVKVHKNAMPATAVTSLSAVTGKIARYNIPAGTTLTSNMIGDSIVTADVRLQEINTVLLPSDLKINEYVDIRIMVPSGVDYAVLTQKRVLKIVDTTIWLELTEEELLMYNSAVVDAFLNNGCKLYAVKYADASTQVKIETNADGVSVIDSAKTFLTDKLKEEVSKMSTVTVVLPTQPVENDNTEDDNTENDENTTEPAVVQETHVTTTAETMVDLIATYAKEYRYYVESFNKYKVTYQPNYQVMTYMMANEYVVEQAKERLSNEIRSGIETGISLFENQYDDNYQQLITRINQSISEQQSIRNNMLSQ